MFKVINTLTNEVVKTNFRKFHRAFAVAKKLGTAKVVSVCGQVLARLVKGVSRKVKASTKVASGFMAWVGKQAKPAAEAEFILERGYNEDMSENDGVTVKYYLYADTMQTPKAILNAGVWLPKYWLTKRRNGDWEVKQAYLAEVFCKYLGSTTKALMSFSPVK